MSIESIVNNALDIIGYTRHIGSIFDGTPPARMALNYWAQTRDSLLYMMEPHWAIKDTALTLTKSAPNIQGSSANYTAPWNAAANPPLPWLYEYSVPSDCLKPLQVKPQEVFLPVWRPRAQPFRHVVISDEDEVLYTNTPDAILSYVYKVLNPDLWHQDFQSAMIKLLAEKLAPELGKQMPQKERDDANNAG